MIEDENKRGRVANAAFRLSNVISQMTEGLVLVLNMETTKKCLPRKENYLRFRRILA